MYSGQECKVEVSLNSYATIYKLCGLGQIVSKIQASHNIKLQQTVIGSL